MVVLNQVPTPIWNDLVGRYGSTGARDLLRANITSSQAVAAGIPIPYPNFTNASVQATRTVNQALRPYPQYLNVNTGDQGGDKSGHSTYHSLILKATRRIPLAGSFMRAHCTAAASGLQRRDNQIADFLCAVAHFAGILALHLRARDELDRLVDPRRCLRHQK
jgi:hypothetical protein